MMPGVAFVTQKGTSGPQGFEPRPGLAIKRIAAHHWDAAWCVTTNNEIYQWSFGGWDQQPAAATDVAVGADGSVWVIGTTGGLFRAR